MQITRFDQFDQSRTGLGDDFYVSRETIEQRGKLCALQRAGRGQDANHATSRGRCGRFDRRFHADNRPVREITTQIGHTGHGRCVAGQHQSLGTLLAKKSCHRTATLADEFRGFLAVRNVPAIGDVKQRFVGQQALNFAEDRQAADPGIEHADRRFTHGGRHRRCNPDHA